MTRSIRRNSRLALAAALCLTSLAAISQSSAVFAARGGSAGQAPADGSLTDRVIVTFTSSGQSLDAGAILTDAGSGARSVRRFGTRSEIIQLASPMGGAELEATMQKLAKRAGVASVEADQVMQALVDDPNDQLYSSQWDLTDPAVSNVYGINLERAWAVTTGSSGVRIAVIDTGYLNHADLQGRFIGGYDFISDSRIANDGNGRDSDARDPGDWITSTENTSGFFSGCGVRNSSWHGTHVSGTIGANTNNGAGMAGINQVSKIVPIRVLGKCGGYTSDIVDGMRWAAGLSVSGVSPNPYPAKVLSLSLGGGGACSSTYQNAINDITAAGAVVVVAAGNSNANASSFSPASCNGVVTVAATGKSGNRSYYSNYGNTIEIAAPGGDASADAGYTILSTLNTGTRSPSSDSYAYYQGTSMATPHVAGVVSLMLSANPTLTSAQVNLILQQSARAFPTNSSCSSICGAGLLDAGAAVSAAFSGTTTTTTTTTVVSPTTTTTTVSPTTTTTTVPVTTTTTTVPVTTTTTISPTTTTTVVANPPSAFDKTSPGDGATGQSYRPTLRWGTSENADSYLVCIDSTLDGQCAGNWTSISGTSARARLSRRTTYEWQVIAVNSNGTIDADGGTWFTFRTA